MEHAFSCTVDAPLAEVFAWHARPGAIVRLMPPWLPARLAAEAASLCDGRAVLVLPGGLRWVARHDPAAYDPPRRFADELASLPLRAALPWRHIHEFAPVAPSSTRVTDHITTPLPDGLLRPVMGYRHRQLAGDLAAHQRARRLRSEPLTVAITGSSGLVGSALTALLTSGGHRVIRLVRRTPAHDGERRWDPDDPDPGLLRGTGALVHLAGASIAGRFTGDHKRAIRASRITPTRRLAELAATTPGGPAVMVAASAVGYYGPRCGDELLTEDSPRGDGFLADVVADWEAASAPAQDAGLRVVLIRTGVVQSPRGGTLRLLWPPAEVGAGGRLGAGRQWVSWIGIDDLTDIYYRALTDGTLAGPVNATAPSPVRNADYARTLARVLRARCSCPCPVWAHGSCSAARGPANWPRQTSGSARGGCSVTVTGSVTLSWSRPCAICSAVPVRAPETVNMADRKDGVAAVPARRRPAEPGEAYQRCLRGTSESLETPVQGDVIGSPREDAVELARVLTLPSPLVLPLAPRTGE
jgi:uncharacterized protein (TIGR01777 family)